MILFKKAADLRNYLSDQALKGKKIGFVPTMGALHEGHISLLRESGKQNDLTVCSIFVNPVQFNDPGDLKKYPVTTEADILLLEINNCDILFMPTVHEMYPAGMGSGKTYDLGQLETILEGKYRPGHFQGVCKIVDLLLEIISPDRLYLGQKDYQQCLVINKLLELTGRKNIISVICPTFREHDGLAMSSRNRRLNEAQRSKAHLLFRTLKEMKNSLIPGNVKTIKEKARTELEKAGFRVDYTEITDANDLSDVSEWNGKQKLVALVAAFLDEVRLIDNMTLN